MGILITALEGDMIKSDGIKNCLFSFKLLEKLGMTLWLLLY